MTFKVGPDGKMADIGVRDLKVLKRAERETAQRNNDTFFDNPCAFGAVKAIINQVNQVNWEGRKGTWCDAARLEAMEPKSEKVKVMKSTQSVRLTLWAQARHKPHLPATTSSFVQTTPSVPTPSIPKGPAAERGGNPYQGKNFIKSFNKRKAEGYGGAGSSGWNNGAGAKGERDNGYGDRNQGSE